MSSTIQTSTWKHSLSVIFAAIAALPAEIPILDNLLHLNLHTSTEVAGIVSGVVVLAATIHGFLVNQGVLTSVKSVFTRTK
jgi:hypothetical protein